MKFFIIFLMLLSFVWDGSTRKSRIGGGGDKNILVIINAREVFLKSLRDLSTDEKVVLYSVWRGYLKYKEGAFHVTQQLGKTPIEKYTNRMRRVAKEFSIAAKALKKLGEGDSADLSRELSKDTLVQLGRERTRNSMQLKYKRKER